MEKDAKILIVGHNDIVENSLTHYLRANVIGGLAGDVDDALAGRLRRDLPAWTDGRDRCADFCYWYFGLRALSSDTDAGPTRKWWSSRLRSLLAERQRKYAAGENPCLWGSWDPADRWGREGGRVYATAINVLTLSLLLEDRAGGRRD